MNGEILIIILHFAFALVATLLLVKWWISVAKKNELEGKDMNKYDKPLVVESGGIAVVISIVLTLLLYIFFKTFVLKTETHLLEVSALIITLILACFIGFIDDILGWKKGLRQWQKLLMTIPIAIPLMVINVGESSMAVPFFGSVNFGLFYPLVFVLFGVIGATNGYNLLAGYNGLEASLGIIIFITLGIASLVSNQLWLALIAGTIVLSLFAFLLFNSFPAKIFPGDSLTYSLGALTAGFAVLGNMEKIAIILFLPFIAEGFLKAKSKFTAENFGKPKKDNSLEPPYKKTYSLTHFAIKLLKKIKPSHKVYEKDIVNIFLFLEIIIAIIVFICIL